MSNSSFNRLQITLMALLLCFLAMLRNTLLTFTVNSGSDLIIKDLEFSFTDLKDEANGTLYLSKIKVLRASL
jgi:hypothetical protein